jgi:protein-S-isoprenylcysteine O-methyltransferase Ste14
MLTTIMAYLLVALFSVFEGRLRKGKAAQSLEPGASDQQSTRRLGAAYGVAVLCLLAAPLLNLLSPGHILYVPSGWIGLAISLGGIGLRIWATVILGEFYTRTLLVQENQSVVQRGPYRFIRHPGYLGVILMWTGAGLATNNWIVTLVILLTLCMAYLYRIQTEEAMLLERLGKPYAEYMTHTWRLLPLVY